MSLAIASAVVASDGLSVAVTISGGTNPILPASSASGYTVSDGANNPVTSAGASGSVMTLHLSRAILSTDTVTFSYNSGTGNTEDSAGSPLTLSTVTAHACTNSSTVTLLAPATLTCTPRVAVPLVWAASAGAATYSIVKDGVSLVTGLTNTNYTDVIDIGDTHDYEVLALDDASNPSAGISITVRAIVNYGYKAFASATPVNVIFNNVNNVPVDSWGANAA